MNDFKFIHELVFGALLGNMILAIGAVRAAYKGIKWFDSYKRRHNMMWIEYCRRNKIKLGRDFYDGSDADTIFE